MSIPANAPIIQAASAEELIKQINISESMRDCFPLELEAAAYLLPAATIAHWIATQRTEVLDMRERLHILVAQPNGLEVVDKGMWYSLIPLMLGMPSLQCKVTIALGDAFEDEIEDVLQAAHSPYKGVFRWQADCREEVLEKLVDEFGFVSPDDRPDLVFIPGLEEDKSSIPDISKMIKAWWEAEIPVIVGYTSAAAYATARLFLQCGGICDLSPAKTNPFYPQSLMLRPVEYRVLGEASPVQLDMSKAPKHLLRASLIHRDRTVCGESSFNIESFCRPVDVVLTSRYHLLASRPERIELVALMEGYWLHRKTGELYYLDAPERVPCLLAHPLAHSRIPEEILVDMPDEDAPLYERLDWVSGFALEYKLTTSYLEYHKGNDLVSDNDSMQTLLRETAKGGESAELVLDIYGIPSEYHEPALHTLRWGAVSRYGYLSASTGIEDAMAMGDSNLLLNMLTLAPEGEINKVNQQGDSVLAYAVRQANIPLMDELKERGSDLGFRDPIGTPLLSIAAMLGVRNVVQTLLSWESGGINEIDMYGDTPLIHSLRGGHLSVALLLKNHGADMDMKNYQGESVRQIIENMKNGTDDSTLNELLK